MDRTDRELTHDHHAGPYDHPNRRPRPGRRPQHPCPAERPQDDLATFRTPSEIADLMALVDSTEGPDAEEIRGILNRNLAAFYRRSAWVA